MSNIPITIGPDQIAESVSAIQEVLTETPVTAIILGSGLGDFADQLENARTISYQDIPHYPEPSVIGHQGKLIFGYFNSIPVLAAKGRFHYYEGHSLDIVKMPTRVFAGLGIKSIIITNAAGCVEPQWNVGDLMLISGYLDCSYLSGPQDPPIVPISEAGTRRLFSIAQQTAQDLDILLREGVYTWSQGPTFETPEEIVDIRRMGGNAVGMSTVPEIQAAVDEGLHILGISCLTNFAAGILDQPLNHEEVLETGLRVKGTFGSLIHGIINGIAREYAR